MFKGKIEKTHKPRIMGKSGTVKIALEKITVDSITYPVTALISKIDNKKVFFNTIGASPCYLSNLADAANNDPFNFKGPLRRHHVYNKHLYKTSCIFRRCSTSNSRSDVITICCSYEKRQ